MNDSFINKEGKTSTSTNHSGGIQGGISNGEDIYFETAFKPTATILKSQQTVDTAGNETTLEAKGRHDGFGSKTPATSAARPNRATICKYCQCACNRGQGNSDDSTDRPSNTYQQ